MTFKDYLESIKDNTAPLTRLELIAMERVWNYQRKEIDELEDKLKNYYSPLEILNEDLKNELKTRSGILEHQNLNLNIDNANLHKLISDLKLEILALYGQHKLLTDIFGLTMEDKLDIAIEALQYISTDAKEDDYKNQRLFDISKAKEALEKIK